MGTAALGWSLRRGEVPASEEAPSLVGRSVGTEKEQLGLSEDSEMAGLWQAGQNEIYTDSPCHSPVCPGLGRVSTSAHGGWVLERGDWRANPGRGLLLDARRQHEGTGVRKSATGNACGRNPDCHRSKASLLSDAQGVEPPLQPLSPHASPCPPKC